MAYICDNCGKSIVSGRSQHHRRGVAGRRWAKRAQSTLRTFKPNLQKAAILVAGKKVSMKLCTRCLKRFKKEGKLYSAKTASA
ncbi:MAG TPA: bL28 family ribosomal protein [Patescibacteria group bacterium]|nr:bL28 family ribosomal protein [Patescibacteria group bacterium]